MKSLTVLFSVPPLDGTERYVLQIMDEAPNEVRVAFSTWRTAFFSRHYELYRGVLTGSTSF